MKNLAIKELNYINDFLSWELLSSKKAYDHAKQECNETYHQLFMDTAQMHQQNYLNVLNYVDQINKIQGGQSQ